MEAKTWLNKLASENLDVTEDVREKLANEDNMDLLGREIEGRFKELTTELEETRGWYIALNTAYPLLLLTCLAGLLRLLGIFPLIG